MSTQMLIYEKATPISKHKHKSWSVEVGNDFSYTKGLSAVPLLAAEFLVASREYPIAFTRSGETVQPVVVVGMRQGENLFLNADNSWSANYLPAFLRRYPFVFARSEDGSTYTLCVDEGYEGFNESGKGERLFAEDGEVSPYVARVLQFLKSFQEQHSRSRLLCQRLDEFDLLESKTAKWTSPKGETASLTGFEIVNREKLRALPPKVLGNMVKTGEMELIHAHLASIANFKEIESKLGDR